MAQQNRPSPPLQPLRRLPPLAPKQLRARRTGEPRQLLLACLATPSSPWSPSATPRHPRPPLTPSLSAPLSPAALSLSQPRARLSPPSTVSVATAHASPPRVVHRLCYLERLLSGESREPGGTEATQLPSSSPPVAGPLRRRLAAARPSPSLPC